VKIPGVEPVNVQPSYPGIRAGAASFGTDTRYAAAELSEGAEALARGYALGKERDRQALTKRQMTDSAAEAADIKAQIELAAKKHDIELRRSITDPDEYDKASQEGFAKIRDELMKTAKQPFTAQILAKDLPNVYGNLLESSALHTDAMRVDRASATFERTAANKLELIALTPPADEKAIAGYWKDIVNAGQDVIPYKGQTWVQDKIDGYRKGVTETVRRRNVAEDEADARRRYDDPAQRATIMANLTAGAYRFMPPDEQIKLRDTLVAKTATEHEAIRKEQERLKTQTFDEALRTIVDLTSAKDYAGAGHALTRYRDSFSGAEYKVTAEYIKNAETTKDSDPTARLNLQQIVYTADTLPAVQRATSLTMQAVAGRYLSGTDGDKYLGHLQDMRKGLSNRAEDKGLDAYHRDRSDVQRQMTEDMKVTGNFQALVPQAQQAYAMALKDFTEANPAGGQGGEPPSVWYARKRPEYLARVQQAGQVRVQELRRGLKFLDPTQAVKNPLMFRNEDHMFEELKRLREAEEIEQQMILLGVKPAGAQSSEPKTNNLGFKPKGTN